MLLLRPADRNTRRDRLAIVGVVGGVGILAHDPRPVTRTIWVVPSAWSLFFHPHRYIARRGEDLRKPRPDPDPNRSHPAIFTRSASPKDQRRSCLARSFIRHTGRDASARKATTLLFGQNRPVFPPVPGVSPLRVPGRLLRRERPGLRSGRPHCSRAPGASLRRRGRRGDIRPASPGKPRACLDAKSSTPSGLPEARDATADTAPPETISACFPRMLPSLWSRASDRQEDTAQAWEDRECSALPDARRTR